ncbi:hypothetical protein CW304_26270 [Bacillus sp. UFRGS-B20]|nr:hypothetical protein CW304_26270 [Bacillus sp. UFRGS-B20]
MHHPDSTQSYTPHEPFPNIFLPTSFSPFYQRHMDLIHIIVLSCKLSRLGFRSANSGVKVAPAVAIIRFRCHLRILFVIFPCPLFQFTGTINPAQIDTVLVSPLGKQ